MTETNEESKKELAAPTGSMTQLAMTKRGFEPTSIEAAWRYGQALAQSELVPMNYRNKPGSCVIAIDLAMRLNSSWLMVMQHVYDVKGRISLDAQFATALMNQSGLFVDPLEYEEIGNDPNSDDYAVRAYATRKSTGKVLYGPWITWKLVKAEGWHKKDGSKWLSMPDQMFHYRAASWFANRHCPEVKMGMMTTDEASEVPPVTFAEAKHISSTQIETDLGSQPIETPFEEQKETPAQREPEAPADQPQPEPAPAANAGKGKPGRKPGAKKETGAEVPNFKYVCEGCGVGFDQPKQVKIGDDIVKKCPACPSLRYKETEQNEAGDYR